MRQGHDILNEFVKDFKSFKPTLEKKWSISNGKWSNSKGKWLISGEWSFQLNAWLREYFRKGKVIFEVNRLDAAAWFKDMSEDAADLAIEWQWAKVESKKFVNGDFKKLLTVPAKAGLAIIQ